MSTLTMLPCDLKRDVWLKDSRGEKSLGFESLNYRIEMVDIRRINTAKKMDRHHDDRDEFPAYRWTGNLTITDRNWNKTVERTFVSDIFFRYQIGNIPFEEVIFLALKGRYLARIDFVDEISRDGRFGGTFIEYIAKCMLADIHFDDKFKFRVIRPYERDFLLVNIIKELVLLEPESEDPPLS